MELQQLRYVLAVAETRNFTRAAERCHIVQSAMSHQIKALEHELGMQLFARTSRRVELTDAGAAFLPRLRPVWTPPTVPPLTQPQPPVRSGARSPSA